MQRWNIIRTNPRLNMSIRGGAILKVFGAGYNLSLFENHISVVLKRARFDCEKALPMMEVFLGEVFREDSLQAKPGEIFIPDADEYRNKYGGQAGDILAQIFFVLLGKMVREHYLPTNSPHWVELEKQLGIALDYNRYRLSGEENLYCPAVEAAVGIFIAALLGQNQVELIRVVQETEPSGLVTPGGGLPVVKTSERISINYHSWRCWFYSLWGQRYEWGRFSINERIAEANGKLYQYAQPPRWDGEDAVIQPGQLLEAHDFKVVIHPGQIIEYWR